MPRRQAAIQGAREIGFAIVAMTLTLASVFAPLAFATGRTGRLFIEFALTLAGAVLVSGFIALTLSPMMCSLLLRHQEKHSWIYNLIEGWIEALTQGYRRALGVDAAPSLDRRSRAWFVVLGLGAFVFMQLKSRSCADRGPRRRVRPRHRAAGLDAAVHRRHDQADRAACTTRSRKPPRIPSIAGFPDRGRRQRGAAPEAVGRTHEEAAADHRGIARRRCSRSRARSHSPSIRRRSASRSARRRSST